MLDSFLKKGGAGSMLSSVSTGTSWTILLSIPPIFDDFSIWKTIQYPQVCIRSKFKSAVRTPAPEINISPVPDIVSGRHFVPVSRNSCRSSVYDILLKFENLPVIVTGRKRILSVTHEIVPDSDRRLFHALHSHFTRPQNPCVPQIYTAKDYLNLD